MAAFPAVVMQADSFGPGFPGYTLTPVFQNKQSSGFIPLSYGGLTLNPDHSNQLIVGGTAEGSGAAFYSVGLTRDASGHIDGLTGSVKLFAAAPKLAGSAVFGPSFNAGEVLFYSIASGSGGVDVGMIRWGSAGPGRAVDVVPDTPGGLQFVPHGVKGAGSDGGLKILTASGKFYSARYVAEPTGTYDFSNVTLRATLPVVDTQAFVYVKGGSAGFPVDGMLVAEYRNGAIAAYDINDTGDPLPHTRRVFLAGPRFARPEGLSVDPQTGDLLVSTHGSSSSAIYRITGFSLPASAQISSCRTISTPGYYHLNSNLQAPLYAGCLRFENTSNVQLDCRGNSIESWGLAIDIDNVNGFSVRNCTLVKQAPPGDYLWVARSRNGLVSSNTFGPSECNAQGCSDRLAFTQSEDINVVNNRSHATIWFDESTRATLRFNRCTAPKDYACFILTGGTLGTIDSNEVDSVIPTPWDPAIWMTDMSGSIVSNNAITRSGRGIELGIVDRIFVHANRISVPFAGLYVASGPATNVTWSSNRISSSRSAAGPDAGVGFVLNNLQGNRFIRNVLADVENPSRLSLILPGQTTFTQNDFGHSVPGPEFSLGAGIVADGGGNNCLAPSAVYPLACH